MQDDNNHGLMALAPIFLIFAALMCVGNKMTHGTHLILASLSFFAVLWCMLSSCMGTPIRRSISNLWEYLVLGSQSSGLAPRQRRGFAEQEIWEMEHRGRAG